MNIMAKATKTRKHNKVDLQNLSPRDRDFLSLDVKDSMKKYKLEKQAVYDRRFALNKKIKEAGLTVEQLLGGEAAPAQEEAAAPKKERAARKERAAARKEKATPKKARAKAEEAPVEHVSEDRALMVVPEKNVPIIMKPIEINFDNFSIKLNGVPKKISVNPDTNAIEIDI